MKQTYSDDSLIQKEALTNEFKGNLFEFMVASFLARHYGVEDRFLQSVDSQLRQTLSQYESWVNHFQSGLSVSLRDLAQKTVNSSISYLPKSVDGLEVVGKISSFRSVKDEADILLYSKTSCYPVSLKLCKLNSFVNTKSGGVRSFLSRYFHEFSQAQKFQDQLNLVVDHSFVEMTQKVCEASDLSWDQSTSFDSFWESAGLSSLHGELSDELSQIVVASYRPVINEIYRSLSEFYSDDPHKFIKSLLPLLGISSKNMIQLLCFHTKKSSTSYQFKSSMVISSDDISQQLAGLSFPSQRELELSSFCLDLKDITLQIRVKPMNKFTVPGHKINCSVRYKGSYMGSDGA